MAWALFTTRHATEAKAAAKLRLGGFPVRLFRMRTHRLQRGRFRERLVPAFPKYLFVDPLGDQWRRIIELSGCHMRWTGGGPVMVLQRDIDRLERRGRDEVIEDLPVVHSRFKPGDVVNVSGSGHLAGKIGRYDHVAAPGWAVVSFDACGRIIPIRVKEDDLSLHQSEKNKRRRPSKRQRQRLTKLAA